MATRIISAVVALPLFLIVLFFLPPYCLTAAISVVCVVSVYELLWRTGVVKNKIYCTIAYVLAALIPIWAHFGYDSRFILPALFVLVVLLFIVWMAYQGNIKFDMIAKTVFGAIIMPVFMSSIIGIMNMPLSKIIIIIPFIAAWMTDTGAYFVGVFLGRHKLAPSISPKKTVEGSVGGMLICAVSFLVYGAIVSRFCDVGVNYLTLAVSGLVLSVIAQIGDLSLSLIKREYNVKDYGVIFPGHGGILDRFDSVLFTAPATFIILNMVTLVF